MADEQGTLSHVQFCVWHRSSNVENVKKGKGRYSSSWKPHLRATGRHLPYGTTQCYLPPDTSERAPPNPSHAGRYSIYLLRRDGRLSWPSWLDSAPAGSRTSDLSITSPTPNHCTTRTTRFQVAQCKPERERECVKVKTLTYSPSTDSYTTTKSAFCALHGLHEKLIIISKLARRRCYDSTESFVFRYV